MTKRSTEIISECFTEQESACFTKKDIYDSNGRLLLSNGQRITSEIIRKLQKLGAFLPEKSGDSADKPDVILAQAVQTFGARKNIRNDRITEQTYRILTAIVFESKDKPWWMYVNALSNYVQWLYTHSIDVAIISLMVAVELGYSEKEQGDLGLGAMMHDIGKLLVPKSIIQKPGPLTDMEMFTIQQHCELGMSSLKPFNLPEECTDIVLQHHEHLDGSGYPQGLKGDEIARNAQIVMIAEMLDGISSPRPYKQAQTIHAAIDILKSDEKKYPQELVLLLAKVLGL
ncbi:HD-GYP domain-containing protein [Sporomusa termitida]|uniref:HDIG: HDIG domain protein n=1 Tax=Sporomusa termitida TaxID=2377 RepID=A0A517DQK3_9FIRM|nr:HD domain-containing phosphohydrolase [Sporomusa termitida]QDR79635.1 HDIG: HDIG domain protein [Sporomusa termitida]